MLGRNPQMEILNGLQVQWGRPNSRLSGRESKELDESWDWGLQPVPGLLAWENRRAEAHLLQFSLG